MADVEPRTHNNSQQQTNLIVNSTKLQSIKEYDELNDGAGSINDLESTMQQPPIANSILYELSHNTQSIVNIKESALPSSYNQTLHTVTSTNNDTDNEQLSDDGSIDGRISHLSKEIYNHFHPNNITTTKPHTSTLSENLYTKLLLRILLLA